MEGLRQYMLGICAAALTVGCLTAIPTGTGKKGIRLACGIFLSLVIVSPAVHLDVGGLRFVPADIRESCDDAITAGSELALEQERTIINEQLQTYILDKARSLGIPVTVRLELRTQRPLLPERIFLSGSADRAERDSLTAVLTRELGLSKEAVQWIP